MSKKDDFKNFVKDNPKLINKVKNNEMTWQKYYEIYDLYGEDNTVWDKYIINEKQEKDGLKFNEIMNMVKNIDVDKVQNGISSLQKALGLFGDLFVNKNNSNSSNYNPRPIYKRFDD